MDDPLTARTVRAREMTVELLRYANRAKVAEALTAQGYEVTRMTVNRWAGGSEMPWIAERMILALFGHDPDTTKEAPPPAWAKGLAAEAVDQVRRLLLDPEVEAMRRELAAERRSLPPPDVERPPTGHSRLGRPGGNDR